MTTNGTRAIADAAPADRVLLGCLRNAPAVARELEESGTDSVYLVCAGSAGRFTVEDFLGAADDHSPTWTRPTGARTTPRGSPWTSRDGTKTNVAGS